MKKRNQRARVRQQADNRGRVPDISVCIPVCNAEEYLAACLDSVLAQSLRSIEIVCVDDASSDGSPAILADYAARDRRLRVVTAAENRGLPGARNLALDEAGGRYIYFFDADDLLPEDALEGLLRIAEADGLDGLLFETTPIFESESLRAKYGNERFYRRGNIYEGVFTGPRLYIETLTRGDYIPMVWLQLWRADFLRRWGLRFSEDLDRLDTQEDDIFYYQALLRARRVRCLHEPHHFYRRREGSATTDGRGVSLHARVVVYCERVRALGDAGPSLPAELRSIYETYMFADYRELRRLYRALGDIGVDAFRNPAHRLFYRALQHNEAAWRVCQRLIPGLARKRPVFFSDRADADTLARVFALAPDEYVTLETEAREIRLQDLTDALRPGALHLFFTWGYEAMRDLLAQKGLREGEDFLDGRPLLPLLAEIAPDSPEARPESGKK
ncbi:MAG: glycosyltransferase family 2 protein [Schwartzia sp.]|nr:glycosyltransferase family 2 protein [Schwartzia sp. (in: firmicutes)]